MAALTTITASSGRCSSVNNSATPRNLKLTAQPRRLRAQLAVRASSSGGDGNDDLDKQLREDMERFGQRQPPLSTTPTRNFTEPSTSQSSSADSPFTGVKDAIDKVLIADFFFILFALGWLGVGLAVNSAFKSSALLDTWLSLWQWVFQPAIGVLMLGALTSGAVGWAKENLGK